MALKKAKKVKPPCTITPEMFAAWKKYKRHGDAKLIEEKSGFSKPTVLRALKYGNVSNVSLIEHINKFFEDRLTSDKESADALATAAGDKTTEENGN